MASLLITSGHLAPCSMLGLVLCIFYGYINLEVVNARLQKANNRYWRRRVPRLASLWGFQWFAAPGLDVDLSNLH